MPHKTTFFNLGRWGEEGKAHIKNSEKLQAAGVDVSFVDDPLDGTHIPAKKDFDIAGVFMDSKVDDKTIATLPNIKFIATLSTGFDHIDIKAAAAKGILVSSVPAYGENTVAEYAFALILALSRKICEARARVRDEEKFTTEGLEGFDLAGKTIGIIGTGRIGRHAIRMAKGFGMNVVAYDVYRDDDFSRTENFAYVELDDLLSSSDVISIHCPYIPATYHLLNEENIPRIKKGALVINTARGAIVDTIVLLRALQKGDLGGAGLDVLEEENRMRAGDMSLSKELKKMPNVIMTPHNAFNTREAALRILDTTIDNIVAFVNGAPTNLVK